MTCIAHFAISWQGNILSIIVAKTLQAAGMQGSLTCPFIILHHSLSLQVKRIFDMAPNHLRRQSQLNDIIDRLKANSNSEATSNGGKRGGGGGGGTLRDLLHEVRWLPSYVRREGDCGWKPPKFEWSHCSTLTKKVPRKRIVL